LNIPIQNSNQCSVWFGNDLTLSTTKTHPNNAKMTKDGKQLKINKLIRNDKITSNNRGVEKACWKH
jgi:hypothetical protein